MHTHHSLLRVLTWMLGASLLLLGTGCPPRPLLNRAQIGGLDPAHDLAATPQLSHLKTSKVTQVSVRGVRLMDPLEKVMKLWGKPKRTLGKTYIWTNPKGTYKLRVLVGRRLPTPSKKAGFVIRQIDIFSAYESQLHPQNVSLLDPQKIRSSDWRNRIFGSHGKRKQENLKERFTFPKQGYSFLIFSPLLPLQKKIRAVFSLYLPDTQMNEQRIIPAS